MVVNMANCLYLIMVPPGRKPLRPMRRGAVITSRPSQGYLSLGCRAL